MALVGDRSAEDTAEAEPEASAVPDDERSVPWFTAEITEITEITEVTEVTEVTGSDEAAPAVSEPGVVEAAGATGTEASATGDLEAATGEAEAVTSCVPGSKEQDERAIPAAVEGAEPEEGTETESATTSVGGDARAGAVQPEASFENEPGGVAPRDAFGTTDASESGEPVRTRGGAHRRQSGLLSTLTGFRRRGRGLRRD